MFNLLGMFRGSSDDGSTKNITMSDSTSAALGAKLPAPNGDEGVAVQEEDPSMGAAASQAIAPTQVIVQQKASPKTLFAEMGGDGAAGDGTNTNFHLPFGSIHLMEHTLSPHQALLSPILPIADSSSDEEEEEEGSEGDAGGGPNIRPQVAELAVELVAVGEEDGSGGRAFDIQEALSQSNLSNGDRSTSISALEEAGDDDDMPSSGALSPTPEPMPKVALRLPQKQGAQASVPAKTKYSFRRSELDQLLPPLALEEQADGRTNRGYVQWDLLKAIDKDLTSVKFWRACGMMGRKTKRSKKSAGHSRK